MKGLKRVFMMKVMEYERDRGKTLCATFLHLSERGAISAREKINTREDGDTIPDYFLKVENPIEPVWVHEVVYAKIKKSPGGLSLPYEKFRNLHFEKILVLE